jgi:hypothetical protein
MQRDNAAKIITQFVLAPPHPKPSLRFGFDLSPLAAIGFTHLAGQGWLHI